jgi:tetratricopeptide (TPR) repeat protein
LAPAFRDAYYNLGETFRDMKDLHSALGCMRSAFACDSSFVRAKASEASILEMQGDIDAAWQCLEPWAGREIVEPFFADAFAAVSRHISKEQQAIDFLTRVIENEEIPKGELSGLYFRLGFLQERLQQYDAAFSSYTEANSLSDVPDSSKRFIRSMREARQVFTKDVMASRSQTGVRGDTLVYIVGMPRSGTSLVEQVLSAHSQLVAGGELAYMAVLARDVISELSAPNNHAGSLDQQTAARYARRHMDIMNANFGAARRITDKTPHNFRYLGLINLLFPEAHIIHCRRNPLDTCTSCYSKSFAGKELAYSNDLVSLGAVYKEYEVLMDYWKDELRIPVLDVPYEAVVDNTELWARRIVGYCGLEWEDQCLEFYKEKRQVHTASYDQVRHPVYRSSVNRWMHFDKQLEPLKQILDEAAIKYHP